MRAVVIYESMFGDNQQAARAIAAGLNEAGVAAEAIEVGTAPTAIGSDVDLLVVGSPDHAWGVTLAGRLTGYDGAAPRSHQILTGARPARGS
ncbi:hypothetical protein I601_3188 [Nocardioides dokdonensis FR1436]|uniref:Flavodoxin-like domain-containing protein n=1 Tax=Nocardioides dokdonensis FR1436 TaxID=1300347 RepID=A0A1A9GQ75_9ACTN|nr:hypothetical protein [Nocardioides dokdonensis]ANH39595.1 hypothetical protein I601_3188 [Nocardioides dokdonensis FR1436]